LAIGPIHQVFQAARSHLTALKKVTGWTLSAVEPLAKGSGALAADSAAKIVQAKTVSFVTLAVSIDR
jgi:hypothetical protein